MITNNIQRSGIHLDVIHVQSFPDHNIDERRMRIESFEYLPVVFPFDVFEGMDTRYGRTADNKIVSYLVDTAERESFPIYVGGQKGIIDRNDILFWLVENNVAGVEPTILVLRIKSMSSHFGSYGITHQGYNVTAESPSTLPQPLLDALIEASEKRKTSFLADHKRLQRD